MVNAKIDIKHRYKTYKKKWNPMIVLIFFMYKIWNCVFIHNIIAHSYLCVILYWIMKISTILFFFFTLPTLRILLIEIYCPAKSQSFLREDRKRCPKATSITYIRNHNLRFSFVLISMYLINSVHHNLNA